MCSFCGIHRGKKKNPPSLYELRGVLTNQPKNYSPRPFLGADPLERELELFLLFVALDLDGVLLLLDAVLLLFVEGALRFVALLLLLDEELRFTELFLLLVVLTLELVDFRVVVCLFKEPFLLLEERFVTVLFDLEILPLFDDPTLFELLERLMSLDAFPLVVFLLLTELLFLLAMSFLPKVELLFLLDTSLDVFLDTDALFFTFPLELELLLELIVLLLPLSALLTAVFLLLGL